MALKMRQIISYLSLLLTGFVFSMNVDAKEFHFTVKNEIGKFDLIYKDDRVKVNVEMVLLGENLQSTFVDQPVEEIILLNDEGALMCLDSDANFLAGVGYKEAECSIYYMLDDKIKRAVSKKNDNDFYNTFIDFFSYYHDQNSGFGRIQKDISKKTSSTPSYEVKSSSEPSNEGKASAEVYDLRTLVFGIFPMSELIPETDEILKTINEIGIPNVS